MSGRHRTNYFFERRLNKKFDQLTEESRVALLERCYLSLQLNETLEHQYDDHNLCESGFFISVCKGYSKSNGLDMNDFLLFITTDNIIKDKHEQLRRCSLKYRLLKHARANLVIEKKFLLIRLLHPFYEMFDKNGNLVQPILKSK